MDDACYAAFYFNPSDAADIYNVISKAFLQPTEMEKKVEAGVKLSKEFPNWEKVADMYMHEIKALLN